MRLSLLLGACALALGSLASNDAAYARPRPVLSAKISDKARTPTATPLQTLASANSAARQRPTRQGFQAARQIYAYAPGALYELYASPTFISTILLEPGETLNDIAAGDTSRWTVTQSISEADSEGRTVVLVKPQAADLRTNIVLITDRRTYLIEAIAHAGETYSAQIAWSYPHSAALPAVPLAQTYRDYRVRTVRGRRPVWAPTGVSDDGRRTWIEFSGQVAAADLPPLFVITPDGAELVNYRVQGQRYMVDRVFDVAELRLGVKQPIVVRIERRDALPRPTAPRGGPRP
ncbi:MAG: TrbG/VirB9 family P-type conjugative transfer protein [Hyphomonadaceae bacterium]